MKIAVIGASGKSGGLIMKEALSRGHEVTAIVRDRSKLSQDNVNVIQKDLFDLTYEDVKDIDVIIDAFGVWQKELIQQHKTSLKHLADVLSNKNSRLMVVGGAGSLYVNSEHTTQLIDTPEFPDMAKPVASTMAKGLNDLRKRNDVKWTYFSPPMIFENEGERTGEYILGGEELFFNSKGESKISYADYAIAMIDEAENGNHINERITAVVK